VPVSNMILLGFDELPFVPSRDQDDVYPVKVKLPVPILIAVTILAQNITESPIGIQARELPG